MQSDFQRPVRGTRQAQPGNTWMGLALAAACCLAGAGCPSERATNERATQVSPAAPPAATAGVAEQYDIRLTDVATDCGVEFSYRNGRDAGHGAILEALGGGAGILDYDGDGQLDLLFPGGGGFGPGEQINGLPLALFRNLGDWRFAAVASQAQVGLAPFFNHACCAADFDNDGFIDFVLTGYGGALLFRNQGDGTFEESRERAGLNDTSWSSCGGWGDIDGDGNLDLYLTHYADWSFSHHPECFDWVTRQRDSCSPEHFNALPHSLYHSAGDGTLRDVTVERGIVGLGRGLGVLSADLDHDGDTDFYVANDLMPNFLYLNDGRGYFLEEALQRGVAVDDNANSNASMGIELLDYDGDGWSDIWVTNYVGELHAMYRNLGRAEFEYASSRVGIGALAAQYVGWGTVANDIDRDGDEDLLLVNGHAVYFDQVHPHRQRPVLLINQRAEGRFEPVEFPPDAYFSLPHASRGLAQGDLDQDGDMDFAISNLNEPVAVLRNDTVAAGKSLKLRLVGRTSNRDAIGARVVLHTSAGDQLRHVKGGGSYASFSDNALDWGLAEECEVTGVSVWWPSGIHQKIGPGDWLPGGILLEPDP